MYSNEELIEALKKGRELRPIRWVGNLFRDSDKACALGAILVGLGYEPKELEGWPGLYDEPSAYTFSNNKSIPTSDIWDQNDSCWLGRKEIRNSDEETIRFLTDGKVIHHNTSDKIV